MRELILMRHAEAAPISTAANDFARKLTTLGVQSATEAAQRLLRLYGAPDFILHSPAVRTSETAATVSTTLQLATSLMQADPRLYLATPEAMLERIAAVPDTAERLLVIAHNPTVSELAALLPNDGSHGEFMATAEFRHFALDIASWREIHTRL
jgi:phosphohistidine phosphatase